MKQFIAILMLCGLYVPGCAQQQSLDSLKNCAGTAQTVALPAVPASALAVKPAAAELLPQREVKFLFSEGVLKITDPCRVVEQDGERDAFACRKFPGKVRCYADVTFNNHTLLRVYGGCTESDADCWWNGSAAVKDACKQVVVNPPGNHPGHPPVVNPPVNPPNPPPAGACRINKQDGVMDPGVCQGSPGKIRCYADITRYGAASRVYGRCWSAYEDCHTGGVGVVNPCGW